MINLNKIITIWTICVCSLMFLGGFVVIFTAFHHVDSGGQTIEVSIAHLGGLTGDSKMATVFIGVGMILFSPLPVYKIGKNLTWRDVGGETMKHAKHLSSRITPLGLYLASLKKKNKS